MTSSKVWIIDSSIHLFLIFNIHLTSRRQYHLPVLVYNHHFLRVSRSKEPHRTSKLSQFSSSFFTFRLFIFLIVYFFIFFWPNRLSGQKKKKNNSLSHTDDYTRAAERLNTAEVSLKQKKKIKYSLIRILRSAFIRTCCIFARCSFFSYIIILILIYQKLFVSWSIFVYFGTECVWAEKIIVKHNHSKHL